jgi:hypothetical protein
MNKQPQPRHITLLNESSPSQTINVRTEAKPRSPMLLKAAGALIALAAGTDLLFGGHSSAPKPVEKPAPHSIEYLDNYKQQQVRVEFNQTPEDIVNTVEGEGGANLTPQQRQDLEDYVQRQGTADYTGGHDGLTTQLKTDDTVKVPYDLAHPIQK